MKIVFMGTPDFAVPSLEALLARGHEVAAVFTQPDKPKGRGHKLLPPPVKSLALEHGIPVYQPATLRTEEAAETLHALQPELIVVAAYGKLLPPAVLSIPPRGCINVHGSLLPQYRGAAPIQWAVLNGEKKTGVTIQQMGEGLDTGDMLQKAETEIGENETSGELFDRLKEIGAALEDDNVETFEDEAEDFRKAEDRMEDLLEDYEEEAQNLRAALQESSRRLEQTKPRMQEGRGQLLEEQMDPYVRYLEAEERPGSKEPGTAGEDGRTGGGTGSGSGRRGRWRRQPVPGFCRHVVGTI